MITVSEIKQFLNIADTTDYDVYLQTLIDNNIKKIETKTNMLFVINSSNNVRYYDGNMTQELLLDCYNVSEIEELKYITSDYEWEDLIKLPDIISSIVFYGGSELLLRGNYTFPFGAKNIKIKIKTGGYTTSNAPADIKQILTEMVAYDFQKSAQGKGLLGISSQNVGSQANASSSYIDEKQMGEYWNSILEKYRMYYL